MTLIDKKGTRALVFALITGILAGFLNGFLGAGGGILLLFAISRLNPKKDSEAVRDNFATVVTAVLLLSVVSCVTYSQKSTVDIQLLAPLILPGAVGGIIGAYLTDRLNTSLLKTVFAFILIIAGFNMIK